MAERSRCDGVTPWPLKQVDVCRDGVHEERHGYAHHEVGEWTRKRDCAVTLGGLAGVLCAAGQGTRGQQKEPLRLPAEVGARQAPGDLANGDGSQQKQPQHDAASRTLAPGDRVGNQGRQQNEEVKTHAQLYTEDSADTDRPATHGFIVWGYFTVPARVSSGRMRVIAGTFRSRPLLAPRGLQTRPTSDRLRETLFNVIAFRVPGARFADLYAGSGAVGIEAISRGAQHVFFSENDALATATIRSNLRSLRIGSGFTLEPGGTPTLLKRVAATGEPLDLVFLDPPYDDAAEYTRTLLALGRADPGVLLHAESQVIAEHARKQPLEERYGALERTRTLVQGDAALSFYALARTLAGEAVSSSQNTH